MQEKKPSDTNSKEDKFDKELESHIQRLNKLSDRTNQLTYFLIIALGIFISITVRSFWLRTGAILICIVLLISVYQWANERKIK